MRPQLVRFLGGACSVAAPAAAASCRRANMSPSESERSVLQERRVREDAVQAYVRGDGLALYKAECHKNESSAACAAARAAIEAASHELMYPAGSGVTAHSMRHYHGRHGCTRCTEEAVAACARSATAVVEIGAGRGHWAKALADAGLCVAAYDDGSAVPAAAKGAPLHPVHRGDGADALLADAQAALLLAFRRAKSSNRTRFP